MPYYIIAHTYSQRKDILNFWVEMRKEAEKIYDEYNNIKDNKYHNEFYSRIHFIKENVKERPDFFEPIY